MREQNPGSWLNPKSKSNEELDEFEDDEEDIENSDEFDDCDL